MGSLLRETTLGMKVAGSALMTAPPPGPTKDQDGTARWWPEHGREQMTHFGNGERKQWTGQWRFLLRWSFGRRRPSRCTDPRPGQAKTSITKVMYRYQEVKPRTS